MIKDKRMLKFNDKKIYNYNNNNKDFKNFSIYIHMKTFIIFFIKHQ